MIGISFFIDMNHMENLDTPHNELSVFSQIDYFQDDDFHLDIALQFSLNWTDWKLALLMEFYNSSINVSSIKYQRIRAHYQIYKEKYGVIIELECLMNNMKLTLEMKSRCRQQIMQIEQSDRKTVTKAIKSRKPPFRIMEALHMYRDQSLQGGKSTSFYDLLKFYADNQHLYGSIKDLDDYNAINKYYSFHCMKIPDNLLSESNFHQYI